MNRPSPLSLARAFYDDPRLYDPATPYNRAAARLTRLACKVLSWHSSACPPRHVLAALVAEVSDLPGLTDAARAAALGIIAGAFYPATTDTTDTQEKETSPCPATT